jgi:D-alanyl-D-alanine carboxypeptidase (penicillin-binding protein 5/6)
MIPFVGAEENNILAKNAKSAILLEESTGEILYEFNSHEKLEPASMTKMMSLLLIMEAIEKEIIKIDQIITVSEKASSMGGSQILLETGEQMSVDDMFKAVCINSANDAITALAEHFGSSLDNFIKRMNTKAQSLGMNNTSFTNVTGFYDQNHYTTAYDMSLLAKELLNKYKDTILKYTSMFEAYIREDTNSPFWLVTTNKLLKYYDGMDGLKTGYINESKYCLTATAQREGLRLISVVMKSDSVEKRSKDTTTLMNYGFANYKE